MTREEALTIVCDAAGRWADEIVTYVLPQEGDEEQESVWQAQVDNIGEALRTLSEGEPL